MLVLGSNHHGIAASKAAAAVVLRPATLQIDSQEDYDAEMVQAPSYVNIVTRREVLTLHVHDKRVYA